ncbi:putative long-chain specific acyl-CoA dehydrogenase, mitochondrial [Apostichopus japonicus]|uniref:Putative long-chain specific acyl-CoA dehydrogenase, mitochondrial n=1 Tax=Stichopus japonicus TaxID=307972 RepID=A0A2G8JJ49_STIJA|nr:putative long-chain specific acyl-CoA dehydrogenase, mitochondrial [Apostichopus japonicus]
MSINISTRRIFSAKIKVCQLFSVSRGVKTSRFYRIQHDVKHTSPSRRPEPSQADSLTEIGVRSIFSEEHDILRRNARKFYTEEVVPNRERWEKDGRVDREFWKKIGAAGLLGVGTRAEAGGWGGDYKSACVMEEEHAYVNWLVGATFGGHSEVTLPYLDNYGTKSQHEQFVPQMVRGEKIGAIAMTEPSSGSDLQGIKTHAKQDGDDWILNGSKVFITNGISADVTVVVAVTDLNAKHKARGISLFLVEDGTPGFNKGRILKKLGMRASETGELFFDDVRLPKSAILGGEERLNQGFYCLMQQLPRERLGIGVVCTAHAEYIFETTREYIKQRKAFGSSLSKLQTVQHRMAEMKTKICTTRAFIDQCIQLMDEGRLDASTASMAKIWASDMAFKVINECLQLHGGWGYMWEYPVARAFVDSRVAPIYGGSNDIMNELIARDIVAE